MISYSLWGKFGQRQNMCQTSYVYTQDDMLSAMCDETIEITDFNIIKEDMLAILQWRKKAEFVQSDNQKNIFIATFTTCWARLKLFDLLHSLGRRALYYDTDSVIYIQRPGEWDPPLGDLLGDLTSELDVGQHITHFTSAGPKNYSYRTTDLNNEVTTTTKCKGFTLNYKNSCQINFDSMTALVLNCDKGLRITTENPYKIKRDKNTSTIRTLHETKKYGVVYTKRRLLSDFSTLPYGF